MGSKNSKEIGQEEDEEEEEEEFAYDPLKIQWDKFGNLRYGESHPVSPVQQMIEIMELDYETDDPDADKVWYIVDSVWLAAWLSYVHRNIWQAPAPGPCRNDRLIRWDFEQNKYVGRFGLMIASKYNPRGDYRKISKLTWEKYKQFYPDSGPSITLTLNETNIKMDSDQYPLLFEILDPPLPPVTKMTKKMKKKLKKMNKLKDLKSIDESNKTNNTSNSNNIDMEFEIKYDDEEYESSMIPPKENASVLHSQDNISDSDSKKDTIYSKNNNNNNDNIDRKTLQKETITTNNTNIKEFSFENNSNNVNNIYSPKDNVSSSNKDSSLTSTIKS